MKKLSLFAIALFASLTASAQKPIYLNTFESGVGTSTIFGSGKIETSSTPGFGSVYHNAFGGQGIRTNYLLLPSTVLSDASIATNQQLTIAFWVNVGTATSYFFTPIFSAYGAAPIAGANTWPMFCIDSRLLPQVNCSGWNDFVDADNVNALNFLSTSWLDDAAWHYFTATFTTTMVNIYVDGVLQNSWNVSGINGHTTNGLFSNAADLKYICLGGNQAWNWADPDPAYLFDDVAIYSTALTTPQINAIMTAKLKANGLESISDTNNELVSQEFFTTTGAKAGSDFNKLRPGIYIKKAFYSNGLTKSTKTIKVESN